MWSYYGSKGKVVHLYPRPECDKIIEPFAGTARYALRYFDRDVLLVDKYEVIVRIWKWLQQCSPQDVLKLPTLEQGADISKLGLSEDEQLFLGILAGVSATAPRNTVSKFAANQNGRKLQLKRIAEQLFKIRHWTIRHGDYKDIPNECATWFIDPPYQVGGHAYVMGSKDLNFRELSRWCQSRQGQVIVCETMDADWLPFIPIKHAAVTNGFVTEALWTNRPTHYQTLQLPLDLGV